jgi:hypothetical protein
VSLFGQQFLDYMNTTVIPLPPCSPDLAPCDFFSIPQDEILAQGLTFDSIKEIQTVLKNMMTLT